MISITRFFVLTTFIMSVVFYGMFTTYFFTEQKKVGRLMVEGIHTVLEENARFISSGLTDLEEINYYKSLLNRSVYNTHTLDAIVFAYGEYIIVTTDPSIRDLPDKIKIIHKEDTEAPFNINDFDALEVDAKFFVDSEEVSVQVYGFLDKKYVAEQLAYSDLILLIFIGFPPVVIMLMMGYLLRNYVTGPLKELGKYAYYSTYAPDSFKIQEIENVRSSMVQTFERLEHEKNELFRMSTTDDLCGLSNRTALIERVKWLISDTMNDEHEDHKFAMLYIDLDNFKTINDSYGHKAGDQLLKQVAGVLQDLVSNSDIIARIGGDEFVVVVPYKNNERELVKVSNKILERLALPWVVSNRQVNVTGSVGIVLYPKDGEDVINLMKNADIAMYEAKKLGKNRFHFFTDELNDRVQEELEIDREMQESLRNGNFELYYQPKICLQTETIVGSEALIRWNHPTKGIIPPYKFIPIAESNGFIKELGYWIITEACKHTREMMDKHGKELTTSVNISGIQLQEDILFIHIINELEANNLKPSNLDIELTENIFMDSKEGSEAYNTLSKLREFGVTISLDDFGTGYSSLSYLKNLPIDTLKIDKSFMDDYNVKSGSVIIESIISLSHALGYTVVAEGIEEIEQAKMLRALGCEMVQGYYYSKPLPITEFDEFLCNSETIQVFETVEKALDKLKNK